MSTTYNKATNFATKDSLATGNALKIIKGTELDDEFNRISNAVNAKADINSPVFTEHLQHLQRQAQQTHCN